MVDTSSLAPAGGDEAPDLGRRQLLNLFAFGAMTGVIGGTLYPAMSWASRFPRAAGSVPTRAGSAAWCRGSREISLI